MKRKTISLLLALIIGLMTLAGCGNKVAQPTSGTEQTKEDTDAPVDTESAVTESGALTNTESVATESGASTDTESAVTEPDAPSEPEELVAEFSPNSEYDKYQLVYYIVEDIDARFTATVSAMDDGSKYEVRCNIDGEEQLVTLDKDLKITDDQTGHMSYDAPIIVQKAIDADKWTKIET